MTVKTKKLKTFFLNILIIINDFIDFEVFGLCENKLL